MSFLESYEAFKANGGVYTINNANQMLAYNYDEPWHDVTQKLAHFVALGGQTVPASYAAAYDVTKLGNCFTYGIGLEIDKEKDLRKILCGNNIVRLTHPPFYNLHTMSFGYKTTDLSCPKTKQILEQNFDTKKVAESIIRGCNFEYNPENMASYVPIIYMLGRWSNDYHFCLPHIKGNQSSYDIGLSCREGFQQDVVGFANLNKFADYQAKKRCYGYSLQHDILFIDKLSFAKIATMPANEQMSVDKFTTKIESNSQVMFLKNVPTATRQQLDSLQFNTLVHTMEKDKPVLKIT
jgi:hypothetical protein